MDLTLKNIGIIKDSTIKVDGLTVITGKNSSGKTTVGKTVHSILRANRDAEKAFQVAKRDYIRNRIDRMVDVLSPRIGYSVVSRLRYNTELSKERLTNKDNLAFFLSRAYRRFESEELEYFLEIIIGLIKEADIIVFLDLFENVYREREINAGFIDRYQESFSERKEIAVDIGNKTLKTIKSETVFRSFLHLRIQEFLNEDFNNQIKPVRNSKALSQIVMKGDDQTYIDIKIRSKDEFEYQEESTLVFPYIRSVFIDNPFALDRIGNDISGSYHPAEYSIGDNLIHSTDIKSYSDDLEEMLKTDLNENIFNMHDFQEKYHVVFEKINEIVPGEFLETKDGEFYVSDGKKLSIHNLATGSKLFFLIKQLMIKGHIGEGTLLILDEPESHLHPEWINRFAEIITILIKEMGIHVIITTHSPNLLLALSVYTKQRQIEESTHFYLAKQNENSWISNIENIDDNIGEGYGHLSVPFLEMSYLKKHEDEAHE